jgi:hypothetical protein
MVEHTRWLLTPYRSQLNTSGEEPPVTRLAEAEGNVRTIRSRTPLAIRELLLRIEGEYREMPGLSLTVSQAERLWGLDSTTCDFVLTTLIERRILRKTRTGAYLRGPSD